MSRDYTLYAHADGVVNYQPFRNSKRRMGIEPSAMTLELGTQSK